ncbi:MAG: hypothetical protein KDK62_01575 [Chlamydiia bacterium]|nr:hypothetical protein [Chlamydiia bacterium]
MKNRFVQVGYLFAFLATVPLIFAAPGGGGGRRGGNRQGGGRTPSMARSIGQSQSKANRSKSGSKNRPQKGGQQINRRPSQDRPSQSRPSGQRPGSNKPKNKRSHDRNQQQQKKRRNHDQAKRVNQKQKNRNRHRRNRDWYRRDNRWSNYGYWGAYPYWGYVNDWLPYGWDYPVYYDEGDVTVQITDYTQQDDLVDNEPLPAVQAYGEWLPLGLFVAASTVEQAAFSNLYIQLAVKKNGEIAGTYYNAGTETIEQLVGVVDSVTQQVAFQLASRPDGPLIVTGLYNLTQEVAPVRVYFSSGIEQEWVLVRLEDENL